jgi:hypothetical protein
MVNSFYTESDVYSNLYNLIAPDLQKWRKYICSQNFQAKELNQKI